MDDGRGVSRQSSRKPPQDKQGLPQQSSRRHQQGGRGFTRESSPMNLVGGLDFSGESSLALSQDEQSFSRQSSPIHQQGGRGFSREPAVISFPDGLDFSRESSRARPQDEQWFSRQLFPIHQQGGRGFSREPAVISFPGGLDFSRESSLALPQDEQCFSRQSSPIHQQGGRGFSREPAVISFPGGLDFSRESSRARPQDEQWFSRQLSPKHQQGGRGFSREPSEISFLDGLDFSRESSMARPQDEQWFSRQVSQRHRQGGRELSRESFLIGSADELDFSIESTRIHPQHGHVFTQQLARRPSQDRQRPSQESSRIHQQDRQKSSQQSSWIHQQDRQRPLKNPHPPPKLDGKNIKPDITGSASDEDCIIQPIQREKTTMKHKGRTHDEADKRKIVDTVKYRQAPSFHVRVMVIGPNGSGKTTIIKRLKGERMSTLRNPTDGLEINESTLRCTEDESRQCFWENECKEDLLAERIAFAMRSKLAEEENEMIQQGSDTREVGRHQSVSSHEGAVRDASMPDRSPRCIDKSQREGISPRTIGTKSPNENNQHDSHVSRSKTDHKLRLDLTKPNETTGEGVSFLTDDIVKKAYIVKEHSRTKKLYFSFWDFAGQVSYYGTHQLFMTPNTVNMLVVDLSKDLDDVLEDSMHFAMNAFGNMEVTVKDSIEFWLQSIQMYTGKSRKCLIVVCTHIDKMTEENIEKRIKDLQNILRSYGQIDYDLVLLDNTKNPSEDEQLELLKRRLYEVGQEVSSRESIPVFWMEYEFLLKREGKMFMTLFEVSELLLDTGSPTEDDLQRLESFLCYQHRKGTLLFFPNNKGTTQMTPTRVALAPMVIVDFLNNIMFKPKVSFESLLKKGLRGHQGLHQDGIFDETYLDSIIKGNKNTTDLANCKFEILEFLERIHVIFRYYADASWFFFMPSLLRQRGKLCTYPDAISKSSTLVIAFEPACRHFSVFFQLIAALSQHYEVVNVGGKDERPVPKHWYRNCACFNIDKSELQKLHVRLVNNDIYIEIFNFDDDFTFGNEEEVNVCHEVKSCIQGVLREVLGMYNTVLNFDLRIICLVHCNPPIPSKILIDDLQTQEKYICDESSSGLHVVKRRDLLKDWFPVEQGRSEDQEQVIETGGREGGVVTEQFECSKSKGNNIPTDRDIGRICMMLHEKFIKPCCLASKLDIDNCHPAVDRIVVDNKDNQAMQLLEVLFRWKKENGTNATFVELARCLKTQILTLATLVRVCLPVPTQGDELPDKKLTERDLVKIADTIIASRMDFLFLELGMQKVTIENTKANTSSSFQCIFQLLKKWVGSSETGSRLDLDCACRAIRMDIRATPDSSSDTTENKRLKELNAFLRR